MPRQPRPVYCTCMPCCQEAGNKKGKLFLNAIDRSAHLRSNLGKDDQRTQDVIDAASARVFIEAFTGPGPDVLSQPSKLWTSRDEFQKSRNASGHIAQSSFPHNPDLPPLSPLFAVDIPSVDDIVHGMSRLVLGTRQAHTDPDLPPPIDDFKPRQQFAAPRLPPKRLTPTGDRNRSEAKCLQMLNNMKTRVAVAQAKLSTLLHDSLCEAEAEAEAVRRAWTNITYRAGSVNARRVEVLELLDTLDAQVTELRSAIPDTRHHHTEFDTSLFVSFPEILGS